MAQIYPSDIPYDFQKDPKRLAERLLFNLFRDELDSNTKVYYSRVWRGEKVDKFSQRKMFIDGEVDFIIVSPSYGLLVVECKGGGISVKDNKYSSTDRNGIKYSINNPYDQAKKSKYKIRDHLFRSKVFYGNKLEITQIISDGVFFPNSERADWNQLDIDQKLSITGFSDNLENVFLWVKSVFKKSLKEKGMRDLTLEEMALLDKVLAPEGEYKFSFGSELLESENYFSKELIPTTFQKNLISQFDYSKKNLICGPAGTGKTLIGLEVINKFYDYDFDSFFISKSQLLASEIKENFNQKKERIFFGTLENFLLKLFDVAKEYDLNISNIKKPLDLINLISLNTQYRCQTIVVDELQDFTGDDVELIPAIARLTRPSKGYFIGLYDPNQVIDDSNFDPQTLKNRFGLDQFYTLNINIRNTPQIVSKYMNLCPKLIYLKTISPHGPNVENILIDDFNISILEDCLKLLIRKFTLASSELIILVNDENSIVEIKGQLSNNNKLKEKITFDFENKNKIRIMTIKDIKGLESKAILVWEKLEKLTENEIYVSMSRARSLLATVELKK